MGDKSYIDAYILIDCPYSKKANEFLKMNKSIPSKIKYITSDEKFHYKQINQMNTFPQLFLQLTNKRIKIGGYDNLMVIIKNINKINNNNMNDVIDDIMGNINELNRKDVLIILNFLYQYMAIK